MGSLSLCRRLFTLNLFVIALSCAATAAQAQDVSPPAHVAVVDGSATIETERGTEPAVIGLPLIPGDRLRTTGGRVEILFPDGSVLDVDEYTTLDLQSDTLVRLAGGRLLLTVAGASDPANALRYQVDTPVASARNEGPGEYRMALLNGIYGPESELAVIRGAASLTTENGSTIVRAGERSLARDNSAPSYPQRFNSARFDEFDRWTDARRDARLGPTASAQYLPRDLQAYSGTFDRGGSWLFEPSYGYVWYPAVGPTWRPYYNGYWTSFRPYGWTWVGLDVWAYPTHHYGRWGLARNRWFWIPERRWAPAWVSWAAAPGYVSWCPLGFDNRPVFSLTVRTGNPWAGWVLVPRHQFGTPGRHVQQYAVAALPSRTPLVVQATAPVAPARAVPRASSGTAVGVAAARSTLSAPARSSAATDVTASGRAVSRQGTRTPSAPSPTTTSPVFKLPLSETRQRTADPVTAAPAPSRPTSAPGFVRGARPSQSRERRDNTASQAPTPPVFVPQSRERAAVPRSGAAATAPAERPAAARPSIATPAERPAAARPSVATPAERPAAARPSVAMPAAPRTEAAPPINRPESAAPPRPAASGRAVPRSAPAQPAAASPRASAPAPSSAPPASAPAGARASRRAR